MASLAVHGASERLPFPRICRIFATMLRFAHAATVTKTPELETFARRPTPLLHCGEACSAIVASRHEQKNKSKKCLRNQNNASNVRAHHPTRSATTTPTTMTFRPFNAHLLGLQRKTRAAALRAQRGTALRLDRTT